MKIYLILLLSISLFAGKPDLFLLKVYNNDVDIAGWYMSEKLDGVRAYWDGKQLISRNGHKFDVPSFFTKDFPRHELDGELWSKRGSFDSISSIARTKILDPQIKPKDDVLSVIPNSDLESPWIQLTYNIFEVPNAKGNLLQRLSIVKPTKYLKVIPQIKIKNKKDLFNYQKIIEAKGGEGVVVRDGELPYFTGRTKNALKVKSYLDAECKVVGHNKGKGKYKNKLGSLACKLKSGKIVKIGSGFDDAKRNNPPKIGSVITFKYYGLTSKGNPRFPVYLRKRSIK